MSNAGPDCQAQTAVELCQAGTDSMEVWFTFHNQPYFGLRCCDLSDLVWISYLTSQPLDLEAETLRDIYEGRKLN